MCGGTDRWRFDDKKQRGTWICTACGAGDGFSLLTRIKGWTFSEAAKEVEKIVGSINAEPVRRPLDSDWVMRVCREQWTASEVVKRECPVTRYLDQRGLGMDAYPSMLRSLTRCRYEVKGAPSYPEYHPAMLAKIVTPEDEAVGLHRTYLNGTDYSKMDRKVFGSQPPGSAVRLAPAATVMGIAEGIETAMSASILWGMPVWAALNADRLMTWSPPKDVQEVFVFADKDATYTGEAAAYGLARKLVIRGLKARVLVPDEGDWNDALRFMQGLDRASREVT